MTDPITDAELDEWDRVEKELIPESPWASTGPGIERLTGDDRRLSWVIPDCAGLDPESIEAIASMRNAFPRLIAEHRKLRAHIIDTVGEEGPAELLSQD